MSKLWKIVGIVTLVAILGVAAIGAVALAQDSGSGTDTPFNFREKLHDAIANVLGISVDEYDSAVNTAQQQVMDEAVSGGYLTQDQADRMQERMDQGAGPGFGGEFMGPRGGMFGRGMGHGGFMGGPENSLVSVAADKLGMTVNELATELSNGKSIADVAKDKNVDTQTIVDAYLAQVQDSLNQAVTNGRITQTQADSILQQTKDNVPDMLNNTFENCMPGGSWNGGGPRRFQAPSDQDNV
jgi:hypothetical protein